MSKKKKSSLPHEEVVEAVVEAETLNAENISAGVEKERVEEPVEVADEASPEAEATPEEAVSEEQNELDETSKSIVELKAEIERLKEEIVKLEGLKKAQNRILAEIGDFAALFPDVPIEEIPDTVWEGVKQGLPLAASYALYEKRMVAEAKRIAEINAKNARRSPGAAGKDTAGEFFSPEDVRRMSRAEVHANYSKIKDSMKKWM